MSERSSISSIMRSLPWPVAESVAGLITGAITVFVIARLIGAVEFGRGAIALGVVLIMVVGVNSLVHDALVRMPNMEQEDLDVGFSASLALALVFVVLTFVAAPLIGSMYADERLSTLILSFTPLLPLAALSETLIAARRRALDFRHVAKSQIIGRVLGGALGITAAVQGGGAWSLVLQYLGIATYTAVAMLLTANRPPRLSISWPRLAPMLAFCGPIIASQLLSQGIGRAILFAMGHWHGLAFAGYWSAATRISENMFGGIMQAAYNVGLAHFSVEQNTREGLLKSLHEAQAVTAIISIPLLASLAAASTPLTLLLLGDKWAPVSVLMLGPIAVSFLSIRRMFPTTMLRATGRSGISLIATVVEGVTIFAMLAIYGASSPFAFNIAYPFGIMVGSIPIFWLLAEEFKASSNEQLLLFGRDLAVGLLAFFAGLLTVKQLGHESYLLQLTMGGGVAFLIAGVLLVTMNARLLMKLLGKMESMTSKPETLSAVFPAAAAHDSKSAAAVNTKHRGRGKARFRATGARIFRQVDAMLPRARMIDSNIRRLVYFKAHGRWPLRPSDMQATFNDFVFQKMSHDSWSLLERVCIDKQFAKLMARALCPDVLTARTEDVLLLSKFNAMEGLISSLRRFTERSLVAKSTHGSGAVLFMRSCVSDSELEAFCIAGFQSYYHSSRESQYKCLEHKIIIEEDLSSGNHPLTDYKFFCASGQVLFCQIDVGRFVDHRRMLVTPSFDKIDVNYTYAAPDVPPRRPTNFAAMLVVAQQLSAPFDFVRVDLYSIGEKVYFGEFTFAPEGGAGRLSDETFGIWVMGQIRQRKTLMEDTAYDRAWRRNAWC